jgi:uncharacterized protein
MTRRAALLRAGIFWAGYFVCLLTTSLAIGMSGVRRSDWHGTKGQWCMGAVMTCLMLLWTKICLRTEGTTANDTGTALAAGSIPRAMLGLAVGIPLSALTYVSLIWLLPGVHFVRNANGIRPVVTAVVLFLLLAAFEEIGFRGYPMQRLLKAFGQWPTLFIVAAVFVIYHISIGWTVPQALIGTGLGSMLFGMAAIAARQGLAFPIGVHAGWNMATWALSQQGGLGIWDIAFPPALAGRVQTMGMAAYVVAMLVGITCLTLLSRSRYGTVVRA